MKLMSLPSHLWPALQDGGATAQSANFLTWIATENGGPPKVNITAACEVKVSPARLDSSSGSMPHMGIGVWNDANKDIAVSFRNNTLTIRDRAAGRFNKRPATRLTKIMILVPEGAFLQATLSGTGYLHAEAPLQKADLVLRHYSNAELDSVETLRARVNGPDSLSLDQAGSTLTAHMTGGTLDVFVKKGGGAEIEGGFSTVHARKKDLGSQMSVQGRITGTLKHYTDGPYKIKESEKDKTGARYLDMRLNTTRRIPYNTRPML